MPKSKKHPKDMTTEELAKKISTATGMSDEGAINLMFNDKKTEEAVSKINIALFKWLEEGLIVKTKSDQELND